jgi:hypothetical protein
MKKFKIELELTKQEIEMIMLYGYGDISKKDLDIILENIDNLNINKKYIELNSDFEIDFRGILKIGFLTYAKFKKNIDIDYPVLPYQKRKFKIKNIDCEFIDIDKL